MRVFSFEFFAKQYCFTQGEKFATVKQRVWRSLCKSIHFWIYIRKPLFFSTIGGDGSRQCPSVAASFVRVFWNSLPKTVCVDFFSHKSSMNSLQYIFHGFFENSREIYIQYIFHVIKNLHKEMHMFFFHYWRSQEPPGSLRCGCSRCSFLKLNTKNVTCRTFFT